MNGETRFVSQIPSSHAVWAREVPMLEDEEPLRSSIRTGRWFVVFWLGLVLSAMSHLVLSSPKFRKDHISVLQQKEPPRNDYYQNPGQKPSDTFDAHELVPQSAVTGR